MKVETKIKLIDGNFSQLEANEIITNLIQKKIQYHQHKNFRSEITTGKKDELSQIRKPELKQSLNDFHDFIKNPNLADKKVKITSYIEIEIIN